MAKTHDLSSESILNVATIRHRTGTVAALDVGTSKVCCIIARLDEAGVKQIAGVGHQLSAGVRGGVIVDMDAAEESICAAVHAAEQMAGERITDVVVNLSGGQQESRLYGMEVSVAGHEISDNDVDRLLREWRLHHDDFDREVIHTIPVGYNIDGVGGIRDPRGMFGDKMGVDVHVVTANGSAIRNLATCVQRSHLEIEAFVSSPLAAGLACLTDDEKQLGVTLIDMGAGCTTVSVFVDGELVFVDSASVGGGHVTNDVARGLSTTISHAERLKTLYGSALPSPSDEREILQVPLVGEDDGRATNQVPRSMLGRIIRPRIEEIFEIVRAKIHDSGLEPVAGRRVVLTGGASQLQGLREVGSQILDKQLRLGRPIHVQGLAEIASGPAFSACAGLISYLSLERPEIRAFKRKPKRETSNAFGKFGLWLRENF